MIKEYIHFGMNIPSNRGAIVNMFFQHDITMCINVSKHNVEIKMSSNMVLSCLQMVKESQVELSIYP